MKNKNYGNHSCNDCGYKSCPISNHSSQPNECSYYDPPIANTQKYPDWYVKELDDMAKKGVVCPVIDKSPSTQRR